MPAQSLSHVRLSETLWTLACQAPLAMEFPRQKYWDGLPFPPLGDLPDPEIEPVSSVSLALAGGFFIITPPRKTILSISSVPVSDSSLSITTSRSLLKLMSIESMMPSNHFIFCCPLLLLPPIFPSIRVLSNESIRWPEYWSFSFSIHPSSECAGLISFRMDWLDLLAVQGTLKSLLQHHSSEASIIQRSAIQLSHPYMTAGKTIGLTRWTFVGKVMSPLSNMLSRLVMTFLPRSKHLLISWLQSPSAMILEPRKIKSATLSTVSPSICHEVMGLDAMILVF